MDCILSKIGQLLPPEDRDTCDGIKCTQLMEGQGSVQMMNGHKRQSAKSAIDSTHNLMHLACQPLICMHPSPPPNWIKSMRKAALYHHHDIWLKITMEPILQVRFSHTGEVCIG
jgi:hypothetical protein